MARPAKAVDVKSGEIRNDIARTRKETEDKLKGDSSQIEPSFELTPEQRAIFDRIKELFAKVGMIGELDCYVLTEGAVVIDRLRQIEQHLNERPDLLFDRDICNTRKEYMQNFFRVCNELSLSPQSRAKMGILAASRDAEDNDPLLKIFGGEDT